MAWETIASGIGSALGGFLSNRAQSKAVDAAAASRMSGLNNAFASLNNAYGAAQGAQANQFNNAVGLQDAYLNRAIDLGSGQTSGTLASLNGMFQPYVQAGQDALGGMNQYAQGGLQAFRQQQALSGGLGADAQQGAIAGLQDSPLFASLARQQENAILANASATGGLRGGNTIGALADSRATMLNNLIQQQFGNLGTLSALGSTNYGNLASLGNNAAGNAGQAGTALAGANLNYLGNLVGNTANNVNSASNNYMSNNANLANSFAGPLATLLGQMGANTGGAQLAQGKLAGDNWNLLGNLMGSGFASLGNKSTVQPAPGTWTPLGVV
jgi:hypothetical protein